MSSGSGHALITVAFGDAGGHVWGAAWFSRPGEPGALLLGTGDSAATLPVRLDHTAETWRLSAESVDLELAPAGEAESLLGQAGRVGYAQLCLVSGTGAGTRVDSHGRRVERELGGDRLGSVREVSAWFPSGAGVAVIALRPRKHRGHEQDSVSGALLGETEPLPLADPRLSTTYTATGRPSRVNLELWPEDPDRHARRVAGESAGRCASGFADGWEIQAELLRCHSQGEDGTGVYLLARPA